MKQYWNSEFSFSFLKGWIEMCLRIINTNLKKKTHCIFIYELKIFARSFLQQPTVNNAFSQTHTMHRYINNRIVVYSSMPTVYY